MGEILGELPDHIFTGLSTKGGISVTEAACFEYTTQEHGTLQAIKEICQERAYGIRAQLRDLNTGKVLGTFLDEYSEGTYIFFRCLEEVLYMSPEERSKATLVIVDEPGKNRAVTKGVACVKVVMDFVNKICSVPLEKGFESSHSGMRQSNHAWNFFKDFEKESLRSILFKVKHREEKQYEGETRVTLEYEDVYAVSTDYETATDFESHKIAKEIAYPWMLKCGIPKILRNLVCEIAFRPRRIQFTGTNLEIGKVIDRENEISEITTCRGVLMGDPLTKVILHFTNIVVRRLAMRLFDESFITKVFGTARAYEYFHARLLNHLKVGR
jgi:hypothetical protein